MNVADAIRTQHAIRQFTDQPVPEEAIRAILDAGRRAQSSKNSQPWNFVVIRDRGALQGLSKCGMWASHLAGAAFAVALISPDPQTKWQVAFDLGQAAANMQLAAWELGLGSCLAAIYELETARYILGVPADMHFDVALSFGYPAGARPQPKAGGRKALEAVVHWEKW
jgi:nitroreductase